MTDLPFTIDEERQATAHRRLNVGSGGFPLLYWVNLDADPEAPADIHCTVPPLPFHDASFDEIWACHFIEHLTFREGAAFLAECYRCLVPGGKLGLVVPDTREIMQRWLTGSHDAVEWPHRAWHHMSDLDEVCAVFLYSSIQGSPHQWSYDEMTLRRAMARAGFGDFEPIDRFADERLGGGAWYQVGWQAHKPVEEQMA